MARGRISFEPGPSQLPPEVEADLVELAGSGLLSASHRGDRVRGLVAEARDGLAGYLGLPADWGLVFCPSATVAMEIALRNLVTKRSLHLVHGAFGRRFHEQARRIGIEAELVEGKESQALDWRSMAVPEDCELLCLTHNETSTGSAWPDEELRKLREWYGERLLAIDATSSIGALTMDWDRADLWFGSVQKAFGLPAGLGFVLVGPRARARAEVLERRGVPHAPGATQHLPTMLARLAQGETFETPNVLALALLGRQCARGLAGPLATLEDQDAATRRRYGQWEAAGLAPSFVEDPDWRSRTVLHLRVGDPEVWRQRAETGGYAIGRGYGTHAEGGIRIANFPAQAPHLEDLLDTLRPLAKAADGPEERCD